MTDEPGKSQVPPGVNMCGPVPPTEGDLEAVNAFAAYLRSKTPDAIPGCDYPDPSRVSMVDGHCRCTVCPRCQHHTGNAHQGHHFTYCAVTRTDRVFHFCCPGDCELEAKVACPHCGDQLVLVDDGTEKMVLPYHDWPKPARQLCPMSKKPPEETP